MPSKTRLQEAIVSVKAGQRQHARDLLLQLVEEEPTNEMAWIWLSGLLQSRDEQILALENSLMIAEGGQDLTERVTARLQKMDFWQDRLERMKFRAAIAAFENGQIKQGTELVKQVLARNINHEQAWLALSRFSENSEDKIAALDNLLRINPEDLRIREMLSKQRHLHFQRSLAAGQSFYKQEEYDKALEAYALAMKHAPSGNHRSAAQQKMQMVRDESQKMKRTSSSVTVLRLAVGPPLLFGLLILLQSGLNPLLIGPLNFIGFITVLVGSLLLAASTYTPRHKTWRVIWGRGGLTGKPARRRMRLIGIFLILVPFIIWLVNAFVGLDSLRPPF